MNKNDWIEGLLFAGCRLIGIALIVAGLLGLVFQLMDSWSAFDPSYLWEFLASTILRPLIVIITGLMLLALSGRVARLLSPHHSRS